MVFIALVYNNGDQNVLIIINDWYACLHVCGKSILYNGLSSQSWPDQNSQGNSQQSAWLCEIIISVHPASLSDKTFIGRLN